MKRRVYAKRGGGGWILYEGELPLSGFEDFARRVFRTRYQAERTARWYGFVVCPSPEERERRKARDEAIKDVYRSVFGPQCKVTLVGGRRR